MMYANIAIRKGNKMNQFELQAATSFLLGRMHGGIRAIIDSEVDMRSRLIMLEELEVELKEKIEKIYYPNPISSKI